MTHPAVTTPPAPPPAKKARKASPAKGKAAAVPKEPKPRKERDTVHAWIRAQGDAHVEAARILGAQFVKDLRAECARFKDHAAAAIKVAALKCELALAEKALADFGAMDQPMPHKDRLAALAKSIATARGDVPTVETTVEPDAPTGTDADPLD